MIAGKNNCTNVPLSIRFASCRLGPKCYSITLFLWIVFMALGTIGLVSILKWKPRILPMPQVCYRMEDGVAHTCSSDYSLWQRRIAFLTRKLRPFKIRVARLFPHYLRENPINYSPMTFYEIIRLIILRRRSFLELQFHYSFMY